MMTINSNLIKWSIFLIIISTCTIFAQNKIAETVLISPQPAFMGKIPVTSSADREILIYNISAQDVHISNISISGTNSSEFSIVNNPNSATLSALEKLTLVVRYTPSDGNSALGILNIQSDAGTFTDSLQGEGVSSSNGAITFERIFGTPDEDGAAGFRQTSDGGYIITGNTTLPNATYPDIYLIRTDKYGKVLWTKTYGGQYEDYGRDVVQTSDGDFVVLSSSNSYGSGESVIYLFKVDAQGNMLWNKTISESKDISPSAIKIAPDGGFVICGNTKDTPDNSTDALLIKTDSNGNIQWKNHYGGNDSESASDVLPISNGYIFVGSIAYASSGDFDVYLVETDDSGNVKWSKTYGGSNWDVGSSIRTTNDGGYIIAGYTVSYGNGGEDGYLIKIDSSGTQQWYKAFGYNHDDLFNSAVQTPDGGYLACGSTVNYFTQNYIYTDVYLVKTDSKGNFSWSKTFGGDKSDWGALRAASDGAYAILGGTASYGQSNDFLFIKVNLEGSITNVSPKDENNFPLTFSLKQNYPNPFNPSTTIKFSIPNSNVGINHVELKIYDEIGKYIGTLVDRNLAPGNYIVQFNANNFSGHNLASGVYFYRLRVDNYAITRKMLLIK